MAGGPDIGGGGSEVRHRIGSLRQSAFHRPLAAAVPFPGAELVSAYSLLVLCGDQFAADRGRKPGRLRLFPLHAEAFHLRRNLLHRQLQFGTARAEIRRRKLVPAPRRRSPHLAARLGLRTQDHTPIAPARGLGLSLGQYRTAGDRHSARHRRHAGRRNAHDPPDHPLERHALRLDQRKGQPDPEQPLLHSADHRQRRIGQIHPLLFARKTGRIFHPDPPPRLFGREPRRAQRDGFHSGKHVSRTFGLPQTRIVRQRHATGLYAVPRLAHAAEPLFRADVRQRHPLDPGHARRIGQHPLLQTTFRVDAPVAGQKPPTAADTPRQRLPNRLLLRFGARFDGIRSLRPQRQHRAAPEPRGLRSGTRHRGFRRLLGHLGRTVPAIHGRRTLENAGTILRHAVHPLVAPSLRRARTISQRAARRNDQNP